MPDKETRLDTHKAMQNALEAFEKHLTKMGYDPAYWAIRFTVWMLSTDEFEPLEKMEIDTRQGKINNVKV